MKGNKLSAGNKVLSLLVSIIDSGYKGGYKYLNNWADSIIVKCSYVQSWLGELSIANCNEAASEAISKALSDNTLSLYSINEIGDLTVGFLFLRFKDNDILFEEFISKTIDTMDSSQMYLVDDLSLDEINNDHENFLEEYDDYFSELMKKSLSGLKHITSPSLYDENMRLFEYRLNRKS